MNKQDYEKAECKSYRDYQKSDLRKLLDEPNEWLAHKWGFNAGYRLGMEAAKKQPGISGWIARDKDGELALFREYDKPFKSGEYDYWISDFPRIGRDIPEDLFPDLTWETDPQPVEIIIKRKKNG